MNNFDNPSTLILSDSVAEVSLSYSHSVKPSDRIKITKPCHLYQVVLANWNLETIEYVEEFKILLLNNACQVLGIVPISKGGVTGTYVDIRVIFQAALKANATAIIAIHNHPSSNLKPSQDDLGLTNRIKSAGELLRISLHDHLIITSDGYYSFADNGDL